MDRDSISTIHVQVFLRDLAACHFELSAIHKILFHLHRSCIDWHSNYRLLLSGDPEVLEEDQMQPLWWHVQHLFQVEVS